MREQKEATKEKRKGKREGKREREGKRQGDGRPVLEGTGLFRFTRSHS